MFESVHVLPSTNTMKAWGDYAQYFRNLMQQYIAKSTKNIIFTAHTRTIYNETSMAMETKVPIKGALANTGLESFFSVIVSAKRMKIKDLEPYKSDQITIQTIESVQVSGIYSSGKFEIGRPSQRRCLRKPFIIFTKRFCK